jgi:hypothetical protein
MMVTDIGGYFGPICQRFAKVLPKKFRPELMIHENGIKDTGVFLPRLH